jgi:hypothetical protein
MHYWLRLSEERRWGLRDSRPLHWIDKHVVNLMANQKPRGAVLLGRRLLERAYEETPVLKVAIARLTSRVVCCLCILDKVDEAEELVCGLLEMPRQEKDADNMIKSILVRTLHELALAMQRNGRTVEAEALFRLNIRTATMHNLVGPEETSKYNLFEDWSQLVMCLVEQGKLLEAREMAQEYHLEDNSEPNLTSTIKKSLSAYGFLKELYGRAMEAERAGQFREFRAAIDIAGFKPSMRRAVKIFGTVKSRVESGRDFESDIDRHHIARARKSKLLQLLGFRLVYLSFVASIDPSSEPRDNEYLWANRRQSVLEQYWRPCGCRRRVRRSQSLEDLSGYAIKLPPSPNSARKKLKQRLIKDWITRTPVSNLARAQGCSETCPCIVANKKGIVETAELEKQLLVWKEPEDAPSKSRRKARYRKTQRNKAPHPPGEIFYYSLPNTWWWVHAEFNEGDFHEENYILKHATSLPSISITPPEGEVDFTRIYVEPQRKLPDYYKRDYAADFMTVLEQEQLKVYRPTRLEDVLEDDEDEEGDGHGIAADSAASGSKLPQNAGPIQGATITLHHPD